MHYKTRILDNLNNIEDLKQIIIEYSSTNTDEEMNIVRNDINQHRLHADNEGLHLYQLLLHLKGKEFLEILLQIAAQHKPGDVTLKKFWHSILSLTAKRPNKDAGQGFIFSLIFNRLTDTNPKLELIINKFVMQSPFTAEQYKQNIGQVKQALRDDKSLTESINSRINQLNICFQKIKNSVHSHRSRELSPSPPATLVSQKKHVRQTKATGLTPHAHHHKSNKSKIYTPVIWNIVRQVKTSKQQGAPGKPNGNHTTTYPQYQSWYCPLIKNGTINDDASVNSRLYIKVKHYLTRNKNVKDYTAIRRYLQFYCIPHRVPQTTNKNFSLDFSKILHRQTLMHILIDKYPHMSRMPADLKQFLSSDFIMKQLILADTNLIGYTALQTAALRFDLNWFKFLLEIGAQPKTSTCEAAYSFQLQQIDNIHNHAGATKRALTTEEKNIVKNFAATFSIESKHPKSVSHYTQKTANGIYASTPTNHLYNTKQSSIIILLEEATKLTLTTTEIRQLANIVTLLEKNHNYKVILQENIDILCKLQQIISANKSSLELNQAQTILIDKINIVKVGKLFSTSNETMYTNIKFSKKRRVAATVTPLKLRPNKKTKKPFPPIPNEAKNNYPGSFTFK